MFLFQFFIKFEKFLIIEVFNLKFYTYDIVKEILRIMKDDWSVSKLAEQ